METSRGRWFLGEYAKRNRNADTRMVLDAVARIEQTIAAQKQTAVRRADWTRRWPRSAARSTRPRSQPRRPSRASGSRRIWRRSARAPGSSRRSAGGGARSAPTAGSATSWIPRSPRSMTPASQIASTSPQDALIAAFDLIKARIAALEDRDAPPPSRPPGKWPCPPVPPRRMPCLRLLRWTRRQWRQRRQRSLMPRPSSRWKPLVNGLNRRMWPPGPPSPRRKPLMRPLRSLKSWLRRLMRRLRLPTKVQMPQKLTTKPCWT